MKASEICSLLKTGDLVFFKTPFSLAKPLSVVSCAIRVVAQIEYNHVGVIVKNWDVPFVNEAVEYGVFPHIADTRLSEFKGKLMVMRRKSGVDEASFATKANSVLGVKYDYIGMLWHQLWFQAGRRFNKLIGKKDDDVRWLGDGEGRADSRFYCYEYVEWCYGIKGWWKVNPDELINNTDEFEVIYVGTVDNS